MSLYTEYRERCGIPSDMQDHLPDLYSWARWWPQPRIAELGVRTGNSTSAFLAALETEWEDYRVTGHLWSFDISSPDVPDSWQSCPWWTFIKEDTRTPATPAMLPGPLDVLFLDTDPHTFESTYRELELWAPLVRRGGVILGHDTDPPDHAEPAEAFREYQRTAAARGQHLDLRFKLGCHGLGIMRVRLLTRLVERYSCG